MSQNSRLPAGGGNLFQSIKKKCVKAEAGGQTLHRLSIGQPSGPAFLEARVAAADAIMSSAEQMHEYQDNGSPGVPDFAERFVDVHLETNIYDFIASGQIACLPTPGTKPILFMIPLACGAEQNKILVRTMPGYPTPAYGCRILKVNHHELLITPENEFRFNPNVFNKTNEMESPTDLAMLNYPHNPSGQIATRDFWEKICTIAQETNTRVFNDAAYSILAHSPHHCTLADVAVNYPNLSWAEAYSSSKAGNFTGWRVGAIVGSPDFVSDIATIKGELDSGFNAALAVGVLILFEEHHDLIAEIRGIYKKRINLLISTLTERGMRLAVEPGAGFFTLWKTPTHAFGEEIKSADHFNYTIIEKTGVVGVHFHPFARYAVCGDVAGMMEPIGEAFKQAEISYE